MEWAGPSCGWQLRPELGAGLARRLIEAFVGVVAVADTGWPAPDCYGHALASGRGPASQLLFRCILLIIH